MTIFARRAVQKHIDSLAGHLSIAQLDRAISRLNKGGQDAISASWELAVYHVLQQLGDLTIEPNLGGSSRIDFAIETNSNWKAIGDVVTVFDIGMHEESGLTGLERLLWSAIKARRLPQDRFQFWVDGNVHGSWRRRRLKITLGDKAKLARRLDEFLAEIVSAPQLEHRKDFRSVGYGLHGAYSPRIRAGYLSGVRANAVYGIDANPLMNALRRKADQLRRAGSANKKIIICCDGGSESFRLTRSAIWRTPTTEEIVRDFLRQNTSILAVIVIIVRSSPLHPVSDSRERQLYLVPFATQSDVSPLDTETIESIALKLARALPSVALSPSAIHFPWKPFASNVLFRNRGSTYMPDEGKLRIPSRLLHELLAGRVDYQSFLAGAGLDAQGGIQNLFEHALKGGRLFTQIELISDSEVDDDWVEFKFGPKDPALSSLRKPKL